MKSRKAVQRRTTHHASVTHASLRKLSGFAHEEVDTPEPDLSARDAAWVPEKLDDWTDSDDDASRWLDEHLEPGDGPSDF